MIRRSPPVLALALTLCSACPSAETAPAPAPVAATAATASTGQAAAPSEEVEAPAQPPSAEQSPWWCACSYPKQGESGTYCFVEKAKCIEFKTQGGADFADSDCTDVGMAVHPSGRLSGEGWVAKAPGAYENPKCGLEEVPLETAAQRKALSDEEFGGVAVGDDAAAVVAKFGEPGTKGKAEEEPATGDVLQHWSYPDKGVEIIFRVDGKGKAAKRSVRGIGLSKPGVRTHLGIQVGDDYAGALNKYGQVLTAPYHSENDDSFLIGSMYYGMVVESEAGKVTSIFWGSLAE